MKKDVEKKKAYEAPSFRSVHLEVETSVLSVCSLSVPVSPNFPGCDISAQDPCYSAPIPIP